MVKNNKKIIACGDIHFFVSKRFDEHKHVLNNFYDILDKEKPDIIVVGGDIIDSKLRLGPEQIQLCRDFLLNLANRAIVIVIPGNHDLNLYNKDRMDSLTPIINSLINNTIFPINYLKSSGLYNINNITWAVWSCIDDQKSPFLDNWVRTDEKYIIGLYHGIVSGAVTDDGFALSGGIEIEEFKNCDKVICSDIHKVQSFRNNDINYTGSLIQVSVNENPEGSYLLYNINKDKGYDLEIKRIKNDYSTININIGDEIVDIPLVTQKIRLKFDTDKITRTQANEYAKKIKSDLNIKVDLFPIIKKKSQSVIKLNNKSEINSNNVIDYFKEFVTKAKDKLNINDLLIDLPKLLKYEKEFSIGEIKNFEQGDYSVYKILLNNFLSFGPIDTIIPIDIDGLLGIFGENTSGKSSIIKAIQFALFHEIPNSATLLKMINKYNRDKQAIVEVFFTKNNKKYRIKRVLIPKKSNIEIQLNFYEIDDNENIIFDLTKESRIYTEEEIKKHLGINETFEMLSIFSAQKKQIEFIDCKNAERLKLVNKFLGLQNFELKESNVLSFLKEKNAVYNNVIKQFDKDINLTLLENNNKKNNLLLKNSLIEEKELKKEIEELEFNYKDIITTYNSNFKISQKKIDEPVKLLRQIDDLKAEKKEIENNIVNNNGKIIKLKNELLEKELNFNNKYNNLININNWKADYNTINKYKQEIAIIDHDVKRSEKQLLMDLCDNCGKEFNKKDKLIVKSKIEKWVIEKTDYNNKILKEENNINLIKDEIKLYKDVISNIEKIELKENIKLDNCIKDIIIEISQLQLQISEFEKIEDAKNIVSLLEEKVKEYNNNKKEYNNKLSNIQILIGTYTSQIKETDNKIIIYNEKLKVLLELEDEIRLLKAYRKIVNKDGLPLYILKNKIEEINEKINIVVSQVFNFEVQFSIDDEKSELKIQFFYPDDPDSNDIGLASGSETFIINICIKVGLSQISNLPKIDSFFIDEGYDSLDTKTIEKLPALFNMLINYYKNVITISHMEIIKDMCNHQIKVEKTNKYTTLS